MFIALRDRGRRGETDRQTDIDWLPPIHIPTRDQTHNLGMCHDQELNLQPFGVQDNANAPTEPLGHDSRIFDKKEKDIFKPTQP